MRLNYCNRTIVQVKSLRQGEFTVIARTQRPCPVDSALLKFTSVFLISAMSV